jgi:hypothetical protein
MARTLEELLALAAEHGPANLGVREAKLAEAISVGTPSFGTEPIFPELAAVGLTAGANDAVPLPESGLLTLIGNGGKSGPDSTLCGITAGAAGQLLVVFNNGPFSIDIDSSFGSPDSADVISGCGLDVSVEDGVVDASLQDTCTLASGAMLLLLYSEDWGNWVAVSPIIAGGTFTDAELTQATSDIATAQTSLVTDAASTGTIASLALPAGGSVIFTNATAPTIQGIVAPATEGRQLTIVNGSAASNLTLEHEAGAAAATQQISSPGVTLDISDQTSAAANGVLLPGQAITLIYAGAKWRAVSPIPTLIP